MNRNRFLPVLLTAAIVAQSVIAGWGHSHVHVAGGSHESFHLAFAPHPYPHHEAASHEHLHGSREHSSLPDQPTDQDDCSVCRHLALAAILSMDLEGISTGDAIQQVQDRQPALFLTTPRGLRRPRSPPELG